MFVTDHSKNSIEVLEARIAPASVIASAKFIAAATGSPILLHAGEALTTAGQINIPGVGNVGAGTYLLYVEKGDALIFTTDFNNNKVVDFNEVTGIAAGDGLRLISFVDINGDIVTNLNANTTLSDGNNNTGDDDPFLKGDGRVVLNNIIEKIELRSLTLDDVLDENGDGDTTQEVLARLALSSYSVHGNILVGRSFGLIQAGGATDPASGLIIDDAGRTLQDIAFNTAAGGDFYDEQGRPVKPSIGFIRTGSAVSGEWFTFGVTSNPNINVTNVRTTQGYIANFTAPRDQVGGDIGSIHAVDPATAFNIGGLIAGDGGIGARGGNIIDVTLNGDNAGGYIIHAGNGGRGATGGEGGSILNFQDLSGTNNPAAGTGQVIIESGTGGSASTGAGGNGGQIVFGVMTVNGGLAINLGNGADGFTAGGNGASLATADIVTPTGPVQFGSNNIASTHVIPLPLDANGFPLPKPFGTPRLGNLPDANYGVIGRHFGVDFDHDGFGDAVFSSSNPNELTVVFGTGDGFTRIEDTADPLLLPGRFFRISLDAPINPEALTVADFNHDGFPDIATGSNDPGSFGGVSVFLTKTEDANDDGILTNAEDLDLDGVVDFNGFRTARQSFLPSLNGGDPDDPLINLLFYGYKRSAVPIVDLEAGDFDGDGYTDLAVLATYLFPDPSRTPPVAPRQVVMFMQPDIENGRPTGQFYANVGTKTIAEPPQGANPLIPFYDLGGGTNGVLVSSSLTSADQFDIIGGGVVGSGRIVILDNSIPSRLGPLERTDITVPTGPGVQSWGIVDTDRLIGGGHYAPVQPTVRDFSLVDSNADGIADLSFVTASPIGFMVSLLSSAPFDFFLFDTNVVNDGVDNAGTFFGGPPGGFVISTNAMAIRDADNDGNGFFDNVSVLVYVGNPVWVIAELDIDDFPPPDVEPNPGADINNLVPEFFFAYGPDTSIVAFDSFYPLVNDLTVVSYITAHPNAVENFPHFEEIGGDLPIIGADLIEISEHFIKINAGNGGAALVGKGGAGGFLGGGLTLTTSTDPTTGVSDTDLKGSLSIVLPDNLAYDGEVILTAGKGGNGFSNGGIGGNITGTSVRFAGNSALHSPTSLFGGDGGFGVGGKGGDGGNLRSNSIERGALFQAGNGGRGRDGGNGGAIIGNGFDGFYDARDLITELLSGIGGNGVLSGGNGGEIRGFHEDYDLVITGGVTGLLSYIAGGGGNAISGPGGKGGSVIDSSPLTTGARLGGDILLQGGHGGNGLSGGDGGTIKTFFYKPSVSDNAAVLSILAGDGGKGISGVGGRGGDIDEMRIPSKGTPNPLDNPFPLPQGRPTPYDYNRFLAGNGGSSAGQIGGAGGFVNNIESSNSDGPFVVGAGAGGTGLIAGGTGGSVTTTVITVGGESLGKALIIAGAGGNATAFISNSLDSGTKDQAAKAFGGRIGSGGRGGSIENFSQNGAIQARIDLIAGDGGDTINYGTVANQGVPVGIGGSIMNISIAGTIGNIAPNVPISSYNDIINNETVADFVNRNLRDPLTPGTFNDDTGLVGLVVGASGRLKEAQFGYDNAGNANFKSNPTFRGISGDAMNITARNIMAMVAGSVERIAAIQNIGGIVVTANGALGVDKTNDPAPYRDKDGNPVPQPVLDGRLIDGAIIYKTSKGAPPSSPYVFKLGT